jgi:hypothetical protein
MGTLGRSGRADPGHARARSEVNDWTLLIDFGTSFTKAAVVDADGRIEPVDLGDGAVTPSGIWAGPDGRPVVEAAAQVLRRVAAEAGRHRRGKPTEVRVTCSARWDRTRREPLLTALQQAGLGVRSIGRPPQLVDYPVAAALQLARAGRSGVGSRFALLVLGAGSAETAVLETTPEGILIRALGGIEGVGGDQFDELLYRQMVGHAMTGWDTQQARKLWDPKDEPWRRAAAELFREVRRAKEALSGRPVAPLHLGPLIDTRLELSRIELEAVLRPLVLRTARELATTIELAGVRAQQLDGILVTGGSSRIPLVARVIFDVTGVHPQIVDGQDLYLGAADWTPRTRLRPESTPITVAGGQTGEEAAAAAAAAAAALAATGAIDLLAIGDAAGQPMRPVTPAPAARAVAARVAAARAGSPSAGRAVSTPTVPRKQAEPSLPSGRPGRRRWPVVVAVVAVLTLLALVVGGLIAAGGGDDSDDPAASAGPVIGSSGWSRPRASFDA